MNEAIIATGKQRSHLRNFIFLPPIVKGQTRRGAAPELSVPPSMRRRVEGYIQKGSPFLKIRFGGLRRFLNDQASIRTRGGDL
jgi:hypothetical protein